MASCRLAFGLSLAIIAAGAGIPDLNGTWKLNVQKSSWGKHPKPTSGTVTIEHHEPALKYTGTVAVEHGSETADSKSTFSFDGAVDGKEYPVTGVTGTGKMTIRRLSPTTTMSELKSSDGTVLQTAKTTISSDGKQLTREVKETTSAGDVSWTEVYDRQ
jgi:hypothetical protein